MYLDEEIAFPVEVAGDAQPGVLQNGGKEDVVLLRRAGADQRLADIEDELHCCTRT